MWGTGCVPSLVKPLLAVDWDGTCVPLAWPEKPLEWLPGAFEALHALVSEYRVVIHTSRIAPVWPGNESPRDPAEVQAEVNYIREMLDDAGLSVVEVWQKPWKPPAAAFIDDRAIHYRGRPNSWRNLVGKLVEDDLPD